MTRSLRSPLLSIIVAALAIASLPAADDSKSDAFGEAARALAKMKVKPADSPQAGRSHYRNNISPAKNIPTQCDVKAGQNIKWSAKLGSQTYGSPVVANGKVFVGTNNDWGYVKRYPRKTDLGVLLCFDEESGKFQWQHSNEKLANGHANDFPQVGICSSPYVEGDRLWYVTNRDEIVCLDTEGFLDGENDGPFKEEPNKDKEDADIVWKVDMIAKFGVFPHDQSFCSVTALGETLFVATSNGIDEHHKSVVHPEAPSFVAMNKNTGQVLWSDASPGTNIMHGQWSSPVCGVLGGVEQVIFAGGDGWLYSFDSKGDAGKSKLLWKFDCNPKKSIRRANRATRNPIIAAPVIYNGRIYSALGDDPELGEGSGHLWCVDPTKRGDVSAELVFNKKDPKTPIPHKRLQACEPEKGDFEEPNVNSALIWHYEGANPKNAEQTMHLTLSSATINNDLLFITDAIGVVHCLDAATGQAHWTHDMLAATWSTPLIAGENVYIANHDSSVFVFKASKEKQLVSEMNLESGIDTTPVVANGVLFIATSNTLYAISEGASLKGAAGTAK